MVFMSNDAFSMVTDAFTLREIRPAVCPCDQRNSGEHEADNKPLLQAGRMEEAAAGRKERSADIGRRAARKHLIDDCLNARDTHGSMFFG